MMTLREGGRQEEKEENQKGRIGFSYQGSYTIGHTPQFGMCRKHSISMQKIIPNSVQKQHTSMYVLPHTICASLFHN